LINARAFGIAILEDLKWFWHKNRSLQNKEISYILNCSGGCKGMYSFSTSRNVMDLTNVDLSIIIELCYKVWQKLEVHTNNGCINYYINPYIIIIFLMIVEKIILPLKKNMPYKGSLGFDKQAYFCKVGPWLILMISLCDFPEWIK